MEDYSAASFTSFDKDYFGTLEDIDVFFRAIREDEDTADRFQDILSVHDQYLAGNKKVTHNVAYWYSRDYKDQREFAVWERWDETKPIPEGYVMIFGHTPTCYFQNKEPLCIWKTDNAIGIDCGAGFEDGRLSCLRLDDMREFYSEP